MRSYNYQIAGRKVFSRSAARLVGRTLNHNCSQVKLKFAQDRKSTAANRNSLQRTTFQLQ